MGPGLPAALSHCPTGVCEHKHSFGASLCLAVQWRKPLSSPRFGTLKACLVTRLFLRRISIISIVSVIISIVIFIILCFFSQTPAWRGQAAHPGESPLAGVRPPTNEHITQHHTNNHHIILNSILLYYL